MESETVKLSSSPRFKTRYEPITLKELGQFNELLRMQLFNVDPIQQDANPIWIYVEVKQAQDEFYEITRITLVDSRSWPKYNPYFSVSNERGNYPLISFRKKPKRYKSLDTLRKDFLSVADVSSIQIHEYFESD